MFPSILAVHDFLKFFSLCFLWMISSTHCSDITCVMFVISRSDLSLELQTQSPLACERHPFGYPTYTHNQCVENWINYLTPPKLSHPSVFSQLMAPSFTYSPNQKPRSYPGSSLTLMTQSCLLNTSQICSSSSFLLPAPEVAPASSLCIEYFYGQLTNLLASWFPLNLPLNCNQRCLKHKYDIIIPLLKIFLGYGL